MSYIETKRLTLYIKSEDVPLWEAAQQIAEQEDRSLSSLVKRAVEAYVTAFRETHRVEESEYAEVHSDSQHPMSSV